MPEVTNADLLAEIRVIQERIAGMDSRADERFRSLGREVGDLRAELRVLQAKPNIDPAALVRCGAEIDALRDRTDAQHAEIQKELSLHVTWKQLSAILTLVFTAATLVPLFFHH